MHSLRPRNQITAWWATRWLEMERLLRGKSSYSFGLLGHDSPGYSDARAGRVLEPAIEGGVIRGTVSPRNEGGFYEPWLVIAPLPRPAIERLTAILSSRVQFMAELLSGNFPVALSAQLREEGIEIFPQRPGDMKVQCTCRLRPPCSHSAALQYMVADALERDPLLLFELRGMPRETLLAAVHEHRKKRLEGLRAPVEASPPLLEGIQPGAQDTCQPGPQDASQPDSQHPPAPPAPSQPGPPPTDTPEAPTRPERGLDVLTDALPPLREPPPIPPTLLGPLSALREPAGWSEDESPAEMLAPVLSAAAQQARKLLAQPGRIRALPTGTGPEVQLERARKIPNFAGKELFLRSLQCVALARRARRGEDLPGVLDEFSASLTRSSARPSSWKPGWVSEVLRGTSRAVVSLIRPELARGWTVSALVAELPEGPVALTWTCTPEQAPAKTRHKAERSLLSELSELIPETVALVLLAEQDEGSEQLQAHLDILGWDYVLSGPHPEASSPELAAQPPAGKAGSGSFWVHDTSVIAEPWLGVDGPTLDRALWLQVLARGALAALGQVTASSRPAGLPVLHESSPAERGGLWYDALATAPESNLLRWQKAAAEILGASPWWRQFWGIHPEKDPSRRPR